jgi:DivIVA domain-containing protein
MGQFLLLVVVALTVGAVVFGVTVLLTGGDGGLSPAEPDGRAVPLPGTRPLAESDVAGVRFDVAARGYRMAQVDQAMRRAAYDIGYKDELINVLEAEVEALRSGRFSDAEVLRRAREAAEAATSGGPAVPAPPEGGQEVALINLGEAAREDAAEPEPATAVEPEPAEVEPAATGSDAVVLAADEPAAEPAADEPAADEPAGVEPAAAEAEPAVSRTEQPAGQRAEDGDGGDGTDQPESDSIMPSRR